MLRRYASKEVTCKGQALLECELIEELIWSLDSSGRGQGSAKLSNSIRHTSFSPSGMLLMVRIYMYEILLGFFPCLRIFSSGKRTVAVCLRRHCASPTSSRVLPPWAVLNLQSICSRSA